jgi:hypothetical protein
MDYSPYAPPQHNAHQPYGGGYLPFAYKPLGWRTTATIVCLLATVVLGTMQTGMTLAFPDVLKNPAPQNLGIILALGLLGLAGGAVSIATWVLFLVWVHLAAKNVRAFNQQGLEYTPGWCVGWWFIPIASMWKPYSAMREIWQASDPDTVGPNAQQTWLGSPVPPMLLTWWVTYIASGFVAMIIALANLDLSGRHAQVTAGPSSFITHVLLAVSGVLIVLVMRQLAKRQEAAWERLQSAAANPPGPPAAAYGPPGAYAPPAPTTANPYV